MLVLVAGVGWAAYLGSSLIGGGDARDDHGDDRRRRRPRRRRRDDGTTTAAPARAVSGLTASSYDPRGDGGDGDEHPADAANALDGDPATHWRTDTYRGTPEFAGSKPGVGLILDRAGGRARPRRCA